MSYVLASLPGVPIELPRLFRRLERKSPKRREQWNIVCSCKRSCEVLKMDGRTLIRWARLGHVPAHPMGEGKRKLWRFLEHELLDWVEARKAEKKGPSASRMVTSHQCSCKEISMSRIQQGSLLRLKRKTGPDVWCSVGMTKPTARAPIGNGLSERSSAIRTKEMRREPRMRFATPSTPSSLFRKRSANS